MAVGAITSLSKTRKNYARILKFGTYIHTYAVLENVLFNTRIPLILLISAFFGKSNISLKEIVWELY